MTLDQSSVKQLKNSGQLDSDLYTKEKKLQYKESRLSYYENILAASISVVSKISYQLADEDKYAIEIEYDNLVKHLEEIGSKLTLMVEAIQLKQGIDIRQEGEGRAESSCN